MKVAKFLVIILFLGELGGCGESEVPGEGAPNGAFLSEADLLQPSDTSPLTSAELSDELQANLDLFQPRGTFASLKLIEDADPGFEKFQACIESLFEKTTIKAQDEKLSFALNLNFESCFNQSPQTANGSKIEFKEYKVTVYMSVSCVDQDLSSYDGKSWTEFLEVAQSESLCSNVGSVLLNVKSNTTQTFTNESTGATVTIKNVTASSMSGSKGAPCSIVREGQKLRFASGCTSVNLTSSTGGATPQIDYTKRSFGDVSWQDSKEVSWYGSGTMQLSFNNWSGEVTFVGSDVAPQYTLSDGNEESSGKLGFGLKPRPPQKKK